MPHPGNTENLSKLLADIFRQRNWDQRLKMHAVFIFWDKVVGEEIAAVARPQLIRGKVLWVNVSDSIWMQQLHFQKITLLEKINARIGDEKIADIRFHLDTRMAEAPAEEKFWIKNPAWPLDHARIKEFENMIASLEDETLKSSLKKLWTKFERSRYLKRE